MVSYIFGSETTGAKDYLLVGTCLGCHAQGGSALLTVSDTGVGIPETEQGSVFSRFHRARNVAAYPGSGLGLAIVKATTERIGGSITFESSESGTEFRVMLPLL